MKMTLLCLFLIVSCSKVAESPSDDYVLIEFASKLEEDYQKLHPQEKQNLVPRP